METEKQKSFSFLKLWTKIKDKMTPARVFLLGFAAIILLGAVLLVMPFASADGKSIGFINALFMSTSAVCVTGLAVLDPSTQLTIFGQLVMLLLIQIGGLGVMTTATFMFLLIGKKISLKERLAMQESLSQDSMKGVVKLTKRILIFTFLTEMAGAFILSFTFVPIMGFWKGLFASIFTAISAFCNAGIDILGSQYGAYASMTGLYGNSVAVITVMVLIICGGLGFLVFTDLYHKSKNKPLSLHSRVALGMTGGLLLIGFLGFFFGEYSNPMTIGKMSLWDKIVNAMFQSATTRTAGFATIDQASMTESSKLLTMLLMFIGACPASTGGGVKTTTLFVMFAVLYTTLRDRDDVVVGKETIARKTTMRMVTIIVFAAVVVFAQTVVLWAAEGKESTYIDYLFESISAFATVGLSLGITPGLTAVSKFSLCLTMFIGRLGPLTMGMAILQKAHKDKVKIKYPDAKILIG